MNLRQKRTLKYNNIINNEWDTQLFTIKNINLINYDNIKLLNSCHIDKMYFDIEKDKSYTSKTMSANTFNYVNQYYELYHYLTINKLISSTNNNQNNDIHLEEENDEFFFDKLYSIYELMKYIYLKREKFLIEKYKTYLATYKIQQWWKKIMYNPKNKFIHNIMNKQYDSYNIIQ